MPRSTETKILQKVALGLQPTPLEWDELFDKIGKGQSKSRARMITASTETRYAAQIALMSANEQRIVQQAIKDYSNSSKAINDSCRQGAPNAAAQNIDQMFQIYSSHGFANELRVTYRLMTYKANDHIPYGATHGAQISVSDLISDSGFVSASENRQFLVGGVVNPQPGSRYVKMSITGAGGINISGGSQYTNANEEALVRQLYPTAWRVRGAAAGQAEILYERGRVFRVEKIQHQGNDVHVSLAVRPVNGAANVVAKNSFTGL